MAKSKKLRSRSRRFASAGVGVVSRSAGSKGNAMFLEEHLPGSVDDGVANLICSEDIKSLGALLNEFILQSYKLEKEFKDFKALIELVLEMIPQAVIVFNENGSLFYQNEKAIGLRGLLNLDLSCVGESEVRLDSNTYLIQCSNVSHKKIVTATNITEQKRQERLKSMGQLSAHLAHEIRNPIAAISLLANVLSKRIKDDGDSLSVVEEIKKSIWRVERIVNNTLLFSKGVYANKQLCNSSYLRDAIETTVGEYTYSKIIKFEYDFKVDYICVDTSLFDIAVQNLVCNAIDAIEEGEHKDGNVKVCLLEDGDFHVLRVYDDGKRIEDLSGLFEAFKTTKLKGHGLGLALSMQVVLAHGGLLSANDDEDKYFEIKIPK